MRKKKIPREGRRYCALHPYPYMFMALGALCSEKKNGILPITAICKNDGSKAKIERCYIYDGLRKI